MTDYLINYRRTRRTGWIPGIKPIGKILATGGTVTTFGLYTLHAFLTSDDFILTDGGYMDYLVVAGGGGGGCGQAGGGGAGGLIYTSQVLLFEAGTYPVIVGTGGDASVDTSARGKSGTDSSFNGTETTGGGGGGTRYVETTGADGGSGGGCGPGGVRAYGITGQGYDSGIQNDGNYGSGGGGAGGIGGNGGVSGFGGDGGIGVDYSSIFGTDYGLDGTFAGGGGGSTWPGNPARGGLGVNGGGNGGMDTTRGDNATDTSGGGGGASPWTPTLAGDGGNGIVIIRYLT